MGSHKGVGRIQLYVPSPMRFKKRESAFNACIGNQLRGKAGPTHGGRYDKSWQGEFTRAVHACGGRKKGAVATKETVEEIAEAAPVVKAKPGKAIFPLLP